jgi:molybdate transport system substrate-binding protein
MEIAMFRLHLRRYPRLATGLICLLAAHPLWSAEALRIAVAANFHATLQQLTALYSASYPHAFILSAGSSGALYAQIKQGAPFDLFLSADSERPQRLIEDGAAIDDSLFTYAIGVPVLWSAQRGFIDAEGKILSSDKFRHLALAEPRNAPYGVAAQQILARLGVWQRLSDERRIVRAQSIGQAYSQVASGAAPLGFVALAQIVQKDGTIGGSYWIPPATHYTAIVQQGVILSRASESPLRLAAARAFASWLHSEAATSLIKAAGYSIE